MADALHDFLARDHARLDALLTECRAAADAIPEASFTEFRSGLLRHIGIEERILFPELRRQRGVTKLERQLHRDHAALAALLVPPPTKVELAQIASILETHNELEETPGGLYEIIESIAADELPKLMERVHATPQVRLAPYSDTPILRSSIAHLLREAEEGRRLLLATPPA